MVCESTARISDEQASVPPLAAVILDQRRLRQREHRLAVRHDRESLEAAVRNTAARVFRKLL